MDFVDCHQCSTPTLKENAIFIRLRISSQQNFITCAFWSGNGMRWILKEIKFGSRVLEFLLRIVQQKNIFNFRDFCLFTKHLNLAVCQKISYSFVFNLFSFFCWLCKTHTDGSSTFLVRFLKEKIYNFRSYVFDDVEWGIILI